MQRSPTLHEWTPSPSASTTPDLKNNTSQSYNEALRVHFEAKNRRSALGRRVFSLTLKDIGTIDPRRSHLDQKLSMTRRRLECIAKKPK